MNSIKQLIQQNLTQGGATAPDITPEVMDLMKRRITPQTQLAPMEFLYQIFDTPCFPRGELIGVSGKAKSGKTFFLSLLIAMGILPNAEDEQENSNLLPIRRLREEPLKILWYDTEQSEQSTQDILVNRILRLNSQQDSDMLWAFNVRCNRYNERMEMLASGIAHIKPDLVVLDGVRDLILDINDGVAAMGITEQLMALAQRHQCCIACVLHQNKSEADNNLRGWLGTELTNKAFETYSCTKLLGSDYYKVQQVNSRKLGIERELYYTIDREYGLPMPISREFHDQPRDERGRWMSTTPEYDLHQLFSQVMAGRSAMLFNEVMAKAMKLAGINSKTKYYEMLKMAEQQGIIALETPPHSSKQYVVLAENALPFDAAPPF